MNVLIDTSAWSLFWRRKPVHRNATEVLYADEVERLIRLGQARIIGPIRQELLSGIRHQAQFEHLREDMRKFPDEPLLTDDYEHAAQARNLCESHGIAGSAIDFLICAAAIRRHWPVYTTDRDFALFARHIPLQLHRLTNSGD
jgi:predicted nucleic acid-binding protein